MEDERKRRIVKLVTKYHGRFSAEALIARPNFHSRVIFDEDLVAIELSPTEVSIRKPIYVGMSILDVSKVHMYNFHYLFMKEQLGDKCTLLYTDTDSLTYDVESKDFYEVMKDNLEWFDTSDFPEDNIYGLPRVNKKVLGLFKDECIEPIHKYIGLRSKMYSILVHGREDSPIKKAKGVKSGVVKKCITFEDYEDCLFKNISKNVQQNLIQSRLHVVHTVKQEKVGLSPDDDKRYVIPHTTRCLPWGHKDIPSGVELNDDQLLEMLLLGAVQDDVMEVEQALTRSEQDGVMEVEQAPTRSVHDDVMEADVMAAEQAPTRTDAALQELEKILAPAGLRPLEPADVRFQSILQSVQAEVYNGDRPTAQAIAAVKVEEVGPPPPPPKKRKIVKPRTRKTTPSGRNPSVKSKF